MKFINQLKFESLFWVGLFFKLILIFTLFPEIHNKFFLNFINFSIENFSINPWNNFIEIGSDPMSYPYGPIMLILQLPLSFFGYIIDNYFFTVNSKNLFLSLGFKTGILLTDFFILCLLINLTKNKISQITIFYWLSPIVIYICYWHGQVDIFPTFLLILSLYFLKKKFYYFSAITIGLSVACKLSFALAIPFIFLYLLLNNRYNKIVWKFILITALTILFIQGPFFLTEGAQQMILQNPAISVPFQISIPISNNFNLPLVPALYSVLILMCYMIGRMNFNLLYSCIGSAFFIILVFSPAPTGWYLWVVPFLVTFQVNSNSKFFKYTVLAYSLVFVFNKLLSNEDGSSIHFFGMDIYHFNKDFSQIILSNIETISHELLKNGSLITLSIIGLILIYRMIKKNILDNEFFRLIYKPILIGITGDSASGKDTLGKALGGIFGENSVAFLSGDDYHLYDRNSNKWKKLTHLNPKANNLEQYEKDCISLKEGKSINCREYDHKKGKFTYKKKIKKKNFILAIGLHSLYRRRLRNFIDLSIYLDVEDSLRKHFKITRDIKKRNYKYSEIINEIKKRKKDSELYIKKQKKYANIIFQINPTESNIDKKNKKKWVDTKIRILITKRINRLLFIKTLSKICKKIDCSENNKHLIINLDSNYISVHNFRKELIKISKDLDEILAISPKYKNKETGIMQFTILFYIFDVIKKQRINSKINI